jgi:hypothetical protein
MLTPADSLEALKAMFNSRTIANLETLYATLKTKSRMSVFRRMSDVGYISSYSHAGRFYTLKDIPKFDQDGLWCCQGVGFSLYGSLKSTVTHLVQSAEAGSTHHELHVQLQVRVHNTLLDLMQEKRIGRESFTGQYLYVSADRERAGVQLALRRKRQIEDSSAAAFEVPASVVIEVLMDIIQSAGVQLDPGGIAERLSCRGIAVTADQVESIFRLHGVKKTSYFRSKSLRS